VALVTDGRFGATHGFMIARCARSLRRADRVVRKATVTVDAERGVLDLDIPADEIKTRLAAWKPRPPLRA
jgi:dihydroxy-acid dehydratase